MKILFLHNNFPAQFHRISIELAANPENQVVFMSPFARSDMRAPGVVHYKIRKEEDTQNSKKEYDFTSEHLMYAKALDSLKKRNFAPDIIHGHAAFGTIAYAKDIFPEASLTGYFEWMYSLQTEKYINPDDYNININRTIRHSHVNMLTMGALSKVCAGLTPTQWQKAQHPDEYAHKIEVIHEGIDTNFFSNTKPNAQATNFTAFLESLKKNGKEIITYTSRALERIRGFDVFFESLKEVLAQRPNAHVIIVGKDKPAYGDYAKDNTPWIKFMQEKVKLDASRVTHTQFLSYTDYQSLLRASDVHIYLTAPFVLSFSLLEAMSSACLLITSDTAPVQEVAKDGYNTLLTDFSDSSALAKKIIYALANKEKLQELRINARKTIEENYALSKLLPKQVEFFQKVYKQR